MKATEARYAQYRLVQDMLQAVDVIRTFDPSRVQSWFVSPPTKVFFTGEGSSRIFPTKHALYQARLVGSPLQLWSESARQAQEYELSDWSVVGLSNSGKTAEVIRLFESLRAHEHSWLYGVTAFRNTPLEQLAHHCEVLRCGSEGAVAATKSVIEQALICQFLVSALSGITPNAAELKSMGTAFELVLNATLPAGWLDKLLAAEVLYFAGRNNGVAEELVLKTNEITRRCSDYLEGTYSVHGIEEVMRPHDVLIWIDPYPEYEEKFEQVLVRGVGMTVLAITTRQTRFPTWVLPTLKGWDGYLQLAAGWNLLVELGIESGVALDNPQRARKIGNEFTGTLYTS